MKNLIKPLVVVAALIAASAASASTVIVGPGTPTPVSANKVSTADISIGNAVSVTETLLGTDTAEFTFTALERLRVSTIALAGTDANNGTELAKVRYALNGTPVTPFPLIVPNGQSASASGFIPSFNLDLGSSFTIFWDLVAPAGTPIGITASFNTTAVPVPAALPLLVGGVALLGAVARKKRS